MGGCSIRCIAVLGGALGGLGQAICGSSGALGGGCRVSEGELWDRGECLGKSGALGQRELGEWSIRRVEH